MPNTGTASSRRWVVATALTIVVLIGCTPVVRAPENSSPSLVPSAGPSDAAPSRAPTAAPSRTPRTNPGISAAALGCEQRREPRPTPEPPLGQAPPIPQPAIADPNASARRAITNAVAALDKLDSYRFTSSATGRMFFDISQPTTFDVALKATLSQRGELALDGVMGTRIREPDRSAAVSSGQQVLMGDGWAWGMSNVSGVLEPIPLAQFGPLLDIAPGPMLRRHLIPFAAGFRRVGEERHLGIATVHYRATEATRAQYAMLAKLNAKVQADVWIAADGGWLAGATITGQGPVAGDPKITDLLLLEVDVDHVNDPADVIDLPTPPVPEPVRPVGPEVHLRLSYLVGRVNGVRADPKVISDMGVTMRVRLDVYERQVTVDEQSGDRLVATICFTTEPETDQRLAGMTGALTVVPLPRATYGTVAAPGPTGLPTAGAAIDPSLQPIAPAGDSDATVHVDPETGQRGVAFRLDNRANEVYLEWAKTHPDEFVALVLDGVVLGTEAVRDQVAKGDFAFAGDYTSAGSKRLAAQLGQPPMPYPLQLVDAVEVPA